jgi:hypothetical protein
MAFLGIVIAALMITGVMWRRDRTASWTTPHFPAEGFQSFGPRQPATHGRELWLVAMNPICPHCREHLAHAVAAHRPRGVRLGILVVDTPKPPAASAFANVAVDGMWWDARDAWRRRWGHRVYGEVLVFDGAGRYLRTLPSGFDAAP